MPAGTKLGTAWVDVRGDFSSVDRDAEKAFSGTASSAAKWGKRIGGAFAAAGVAKFAADAIGAASDISESLSKNDKLFGKYAKTIDSFSRESAQSFGISRKATLEYTGVFGNLFRALGQSEKASATQSIALTKLAADMASFNNTSVEEALDAIRSGLVGETEPLRKFGVNMNDATLKAQALKMGLIDSVKEGLSPQVKALAASALIAKQTEQAHGDFAKTSGGLANQQKILQARFADMTAELGARLLPVALKVVQWAMDFMDALPGVVEWVKKTGQAVADWVTDFDAIPGGLGDVAKALGGAFVDGLKALPGLLVDAAKWYTETYIKAVKGLLGLYADAGKWVLGVLVDGVKAVPGLLLDLAKWVGDQLVNGIKAYVTFYANAGRWILDQLVAGVKALPGVALGAAVWVKDQIVNGITGLISSFTTIGGWITNRLVDGLKGATAFLSTVGSWVLARVRETIEGAIDGFKTVGGWITNRLVDGLKGATAFLATVGGWVKERVRDTVEGAIDGFKDIGGWVTNRIVDGLKGATAFIATVGGWIKERIRDAVEGAIDGFKSIGGWIINRIVDGLKAGGNLIVGFLNKIIGVINKIPGVHIDAIATFRTGGVIEGFANGGEIRRGTKLTQPTILMGEEAPRHPEYVIPTNPAYRGRARKLYADLGDELGVQGHARGGVIALADGGVIGQTITNLPNTIGGLFGGGNPITKLTDALPSPKSLPAWLQGLGTFVISKVTGWIKDKVGGLVGGGGGGVGNVNGLVEQVKTALAWARGMGWKGTVTSGFRSYAQQAALYAAYLNGTGNLAAKPGTSNHESGQAVDITDAGTFARIMANAPSGARLYNRIAGEPWHWSVTGYQQGGKIQGPYVGSYADGGVVPQTGFAYVHKGETIAPPNLMPDAIEVYLDGERIIDERVQVRLRQRDRSSVQQFRAGVR